MKKLHRDDLFCWSVFDESKNIDFSGYALVHPSGNVLVDPPPMSVHDTAHLEGLGGAAWIVITNSDHVRGVPELAARFNAKIATPAAESGNAKFTFPVARSLAEGDELVAGLKTLELQGSKTPGELALLLDETTLFCGDLVRCHRAGTLMMLAPPEPGLFDRATAIAAVRRLAALPKVDAVLVGDGFSVYRDGRRALQELAATLA